MSGAQGICLCAGRVVEVRLEGGRGHRLPGPGQGLNLTALGSPECCHTEECHS